MEEQAIYKGAFAMIRISGRVKGVSDYVVDLDITEDEFSNLSMVQQNKLIEDNIDFTLLEIHSVEIDDEVDIEVFE